MNANELLKDILAKDEIVEWSATPKPYSVLNGENKQSTVLLWIIAAALFLILNIAYIALCVSDETMDFMIGVLLVTVGVPAFMCVNPLRDEMHIAKQLLAITNKRVIIFHKSNKELSVPIEEIDAVHIEASTDAGYSHVRIGSSVAAVPAKKLRSLAIVGKSDDDDKCIGLVFYHVDAHEGETAYDALRAKTEARVEVNNA
jgi:hypothetical protein